MQKFVLDLGGVEYKSLDDATVMETTIHVGPQDAVIIAEAVLQKNMPHALRTMEETVDAFRLENETNRLRVALEDILKATEPHRLVGSSHGVLMGAIDAIHNRAAAALGKTDLPKPNKGEVRKVDTWKPFAEAGDRPKCFGIPARLDDCRKTPDACAVFDYCLDAADAKQKPTFKVGDKVRVKADGQEGTISDISSDGLLGVHFEGYSFEAPYHVPSYYALYRPDALEPVDATLPNPNEPGYVEPCQHEKVYDGGRYAILDKLLSEWGITHLRVTRFDAYKEQPWLGEIGEYRTFVNAGYGDSPSEALREAMEARKETAREDKDSHV